LFAAARPPGPAAAPLAPLARPPAPPVCASKHVPRNTRQHPASCPQLAPLTGRITSPEPATAARRQPFFMRCGSRLCGWGGPLQLPGGASPPWCGGVTRPRMLLTALPAACTGAAPRGVFRAAARMHALKGPSALSGASATRRPPAAPTSCTDWPRDFRCSDVTVDCCSLIVDACVCVCVCVCMCVCVCESVCALFFGCDFCQALVLMVVANSATPGPWWLMAL
jgi:hypothetical protein